MSKPLRWQQTEPGRVYGIRPDGFDYLKVGFCRDSYDRLKTLQVAWPVSLQWVFLIAGTRELEQAIHLRIWKHRARGDWFHYNDAVREFIGGLLESHPSVHTMDSPTTQPMEVCEHVVPCGGWRCERCGLAAALVRRQATIRT